jgi:predicted transcriptional regulator
LLTREKDGRRYLYSPKLNRADFHARLAVEVMQSLPDSGRDAALAALVGDSDEVDMSMLERLEEMIAERRAALDGDANASSDEE